MDPTVRVDLHLHSTHSDGALAPAALARRLAEDEVRFAALTDHNTLDGLPAFRAALAREGIGFVAGVELHAETPHGPAHLLAYGFDPTDAALGAALAACARAARGPEGPAVGVGLTEPPRAPSSATLIATVHAAGGRAFLAHPLTPPRDPAALSALVAALAAEGLDGLEAVYAAYTADEQQRLAALAEAHGLLLGAGSDFHRDDGPRPQRLGVELPEPRWRALRDALLASGRPVGAAAAQGGAEPAPAPAAVRVRRRFALRVLLPTLLAVALFVAPMLLIVVPAFEDALISRKRDMIRELTHTAWSILAEHHADELAGRLTRDEAQRAALSRVEFLRYGQEGKDYFWVTDMHPRMLMHPYRTDLNGQDLSNFRDPNGVPVFTRFVELVRARQEGHLAYVWQWKDDPARLAPKQSYVRGFAPWGWVIGTGLYVEDVDEETSAFTRRVLALFAVIVLVVALLLLVATLQSLRIERQRLAAEGALRESHEKYRSLVEASLDAMMVVVGGRLTYANQTLLAQLGYSADELGLLELDEVLAELDPASADPRPPGAWLAAALARGGPIDPVEARIRRRDGSTLVVHLTFERLALGERHGAILVAKDLSLPRAQAAALEANHAASWALALALPTPVVRVSPAGPMPLLAANPAAAALLHHPPGAPAPPPTLADLVPDPAAFAALRAELLSPAGAPARPFRLAGPAAGARVHLTGVPARDARGDVCFCTLLLDPEPAPDAPQAAAPPEAPAPAEPLAGAAPLRALARPLARCPHDAPLAAAVARMSAPDATALLVTAPGGEPLGLVTERDLRLRVLAPGLSLARPVHEVMSAPLVTLAPSALAHEALALMQARAVGSVVLRDPDGAVLGAVHRADLRDLERHPLAALLAEIHGARRLDALVAARARLPGLVASLVDAGARPRHAGRVVTAVSDALTRRLVAWAEDELGPAPAPFAFLALGSQGREEQTLVTDQDNAIVYDPPEGADEAALARYFLALGARVCDGLAEAGIAPCKGEVMAKNPRWCAPLAAWKGYFSAWIRVADPQHLLEFNTFFDLRAVGGDPTLAVALRRHVAAWLAENPPFFVHLAQSVNLHRPPLTFFGNIAAEPEPGGRVRAFNLKEAMTPLVSFARLYALRGGLSEVNTFDRLEALRDRGLLGADTFAETFAAYEHLLALRLRHQTATRAAGEPASNHLRIERLTEIDRATLKQVLAQVAILQKKVAYDFLGGA